MSFFWSVATALTVYGIETIVNIKTIEPKFELQRHLPFTVLKLLIIMLTDNNLPVATALTVYGIETRHSVIAITKFGALQRHLPFTVLKLSCSRAT